MKGIVVNARPALAHKNTWQYQVLTAHSEDERLYFLIDNECSSAYQLGDIVDLPEHQWNPDRDYLADPIDVNHPRIDDYVTEQTDMPMLLEAAKHEYGNIESLQELVDLNASAMIQKHRFHVGIDNVLENINMTPTVASNLISIDPTYIVYVPDPTPNQQLTSLMGCIEEDRPIPAEIRPEIYQLYNRDVVGNRQVEKLAGEINTLLSEHKVRDLDGVSSDLLADKRFPNAIDAICNHNFEDTCVHHDTGQKLAENHLMRNVEKREEVEKGGIER